MGETLCNGMIVDENWDMCYLSKDKTHPNRSSMSNNFCNHMTLLGYLEAVCTSVANTAVCVILKPILETTFVQRPPGYRDHCR